MERPREARTCRVKRKRAHHLVRTSGMLKEARKLLWESVNEREEEVPTSGKD